MEPNRSDQSERNETETEPNFQTSERRIVAFKLKTI